MARNYRLEVSASLENLSDIRDFVKMAASELGLSGRAMNDLLVAVDEAATNVVLHGYRGRDGGIEILVDRRDGAVAVQLVDNAAPFDRQGVNGPDLTQPLQTRNVGGMGLHLIRTLTEEVTYEPLPGGGNRLTLVKNIAP